MSLVSSLCAKRLSLAKDKKSLLCAWLDPALFQMWRGEKWLPSSIKTDAQLYDRALSYIDAVSPYVSWIKYNTKYREGTWQWDVLQRLTDYSKKIWLFVVEDGKLADIWSTNDASLFYTNQRHPDTVTIAPYAGNMQWTIHDATKRNLWVFTMCLMSSPEYETEKNMLILVTSTKVDRYKTNNLICIDGCWYIKRYVYLAYESRKCWALWVVIWAPSADNHISNQEIRSVADILSEDQLILCPWTWSQWGDPSVVVQYFWSRVLVCMSRWLMFPDWSLSTPDQQAAIAKYWRDKIHLWNNSYIFDTSVK